ncbi:MAG TPA: hypothetical protein VNZ06_02895 [Steroidobacteraceae bacterium]|jgi:hypothetical protein|nr:hypothetical protein [Steroidobacteraceae bacterium]
MCLARAEKRPRSTFFAVAFTGWLTALACLGGCSLITIKSPEKPLSTRDLNARILTHEYAAHFISAIEQTADEIADGTQDTRIRLNTLRWKIAVAASSQRAASQIVPMMSLLDTWALSVQMAQYLDTGNGGALFGAQQSQAVTLARELAHDAETSARGLLSSQEFTRDQRFVEHYARDYPLQSLNFTRPSIVERWVRENGSESKLIESLGTVPESLAEARDLVRMYGDNTPEQILWKAQLLAQQSGVNGRDVQSALKQLDERMARLSALADQTPDLLNGIVRDVQRRADTSWSQMLGELRTQGMTLSGTLSSEREAATQSINEQREALTADAVRISTQLVQQAGIEARRLVREALILIIVLALVVLGLPFTAGYLVGRARRSA